MLSNIYYIYELRYMLFKLAILGAKVKYEY